MNKKLCPFCLHASRSVCPRALTGSRVHSELNNFLFLFLQFFLCVVLQIYTLNALFYFLPDEWSFMIFAPRDSLLGLQVSLNFKMCNTNLNHYGNHSCTDLYQFISYGDFEASYTTMGLPTFSFTGRGLVQY